MKTNTQVVDLPVPGERHIPYSYEAEMAVLGAMILEKEAISKALSYLDETCFYKENHRTIFRAIVNLFQQNTVVDIVTVSEALKKCGRLDVAGGPDYLTDISDYPTAAKVGYHAKIVLEKAVLRKLIEAGDKITARCYEPGAEPKDELQGANTLLMEIARYVVRSSRGGLRSISPAIAQELERLKEIRRGEEVSSGLSTGFDDIDRKIKGLRGQDLMVISGRTGTGKSTMAVAIINHIAFEQNIPVAIFSLEMSQNQLAIRVLQSCTEINEEMVSEGITPDEFNRLEQIALKYKNAPIFVSDENASIQDIRLQAQQQKLRQPDLGLVVIDHSQRLDEKGSSMYERASTGVKGAKDLAKDLDIPVILLSQLSRRGELRDSGRIEEEANFILELSRPGPHDEDMNEVDTANTTLVNIKKNRDGPTGSVMIYHNREITKMGNLSTSRIK